MPAMRRISRVLHNLLHRSRVDRDLDQELASYLELLTSQNIAGGMAPEDARRAALLELGGMDAVKESVRDARAGVWLQQAVQDLHYGLRSLRRAPGFSVAMILILSLAIGANTAVFSVIEGVLLRPWPYRDPDRLCVLWKSIPQRNIEWDWTSAPTVRDWRDHSAVFEDIALILRPEGSRVTWHTPAGPETLQGSLVSANFFDVLGANPMLGRTFSARGSNDGVVVSHGFWIRRFGGSPSALGRVLRLDGRIVHVIGVMPPAFQFPDKQAELWIPLEGDPRWPVFQLPKFRIADAFCALGRLKEGRTFPQARAEMSAIASRLASQYPATDAGLAIRVVPLSEQIAGPNIQRALWLLAAAVLCVLLIACFNMAGLQMARAAGRRQEFAVRAALGAGHRRILRQLAAEGLLLTLLGGVGGVGLAFAGLHSLLSLAPPDLPRSSGIGMNLAVLGFSAALCVLAGLVFSLVPMYRTVRSELHPALGQGTRGSSGVGAGRWRGLLVAAQYAFAFALLFGAGLLLRSFLLLEAVDRGFDTSRLVTVSVSLPSPKYNQPARVQAFLEEAIQRLQAIPGVEGAAVGSARMGTFRGNAPNQNIVVEGQPFSQDPVVHARVIVTEDYFRLLGIPILQGRALSRYDTARQPLVAVINQAMARQFWPRANPVGKRFQQLLPGTAGTWIMVVGVAGDVVYSRDGFVVPVFYSPVSQWHLTEHEMVVRTASDPRPLVGSIPRALQSVDPSLPRFPAAAVDDELAAQDRPRRFQTLLTTIFALLALILAATGLYALVAYSVEQRRREFGIRLALGSTASGIARLVLHHGVGWGIGGIIAGTFAASAFARGLSALLFGITPADPVTLLAVLSLLLLVMIASSALPAIRASRIDPVTALRQD